MRLTRRHNVEKRPGSVATCHVKPAITGVTQHLRVGVGRFFTLCVCAAVLLAGSASAHTLAANKQAARRDAQMLLGRLRLPAGAVRLSGPWVKPGGLWKPARDLMAAATSWRVPGSVARVGSFIKRHRPRGGRDPLTSTTTQSGELIQEVISYFWPMVPQVLRERELDIVIKQQPDGSAHVQARDAVSWWIPRRGDARVLARASVLRVTRGSSRLLASHDHAKVERVAEMLDRLQIIPTGTVVSCYGVAESAAPVDFTFQARGKELARATIPPGGGSPCAPITFTVAGHRPEFLLSSPSFLRRAGSVLGMRLAS